MKKLTTSLMIIILFLCILSIVVPTIHHPIINTKAKQAQIYIELLSQAVTVYHDEFGTIPNENQGLAILVENDVIKEIPLDPWGERFVYSTPSSDSFVIYSLGSMLFGEKVVISAYVNSENGFTTKQLLANGT